MEEQKLHHFAPLPVGERRPGETPQTGRAHSRRFPRSHSRNRFWRLVSRPRESTSRSERALSIPSTASERSLPGAAAARRDAQKGGPSSESCAFQIEISSRVEPGSRGRKGKESEGAEVAEAEEEGVSDEISERAKKGTRREKKTIDSLLLLQNSILFFRFSTASPLDCSLLSP